jgi:hypothetical protein
MSVRQLPGARWLRALSSARQRCRVRGAAWQVLACAGALALAACGGGSGSAGDSGGNGNSRLSLGSAQDPDPVVVDFPVAYVQRPLARDEDGALLATDVRQPLAFRPGARLVVRDRASPSAPERVVSDAAFATAAESAPLYDVRGIEASYDGNELVFAMRAPEIDGAAPEDQPTWNIWTWDRRTGQLDRVIDSDLLAEAGQDTDPHFLPDGRIVFTSTRGRRTRAVLLDEGKPQYAPLTDDGRAEVLNLHVMERDGSDIRQISFNLSHDLAPSVLADGRIVFSRWDNAAGANRISLYTVRPDGSGLELLYGYHSHDTGTGGAAIEFLDARELTDNRLLVMPRPRAAAVRAGTDPLAIDVAAYTEIDQAAGGSGLAGPAQERLVAGDVRSDDSISPAGRYLSAFPLDDGSNRLLVTWSQCRLLEAGRIVPCVQPAPPPAGAPAPVEADPLYGVWVLDLDEQTQQVVVPPTEGMLRDEAVVLAPRTAPAVLLPPVPGIDVDADLVAGEAGVLAIRSVHDFDGVDRSGAGIAALRDPTVTPPAARPIRFVRFTKPVLMPPRSVLQVPGTAFGASAGQGMREIVGYAPVEPDGSVRVKLPADVPITFTLLDADGRQVSARHNHWLQLAAGEVRTCNGCHTRDSERPHGRTDAELPSANPGAPAPGPFPNANPAIAAEAGESMADARARIAGAEPDPALDLTFSDVWSDPARQAPAASFAYRYADLDTAAPASTACQQRWAARCRAVIHYPDHVAPLFALPRQVLDVDGVTVLEDHTCVTCHAEADANGAAMVPAGQLDLSATPSRDVPAHLVSYRELFFGDVEQEVVNGVLVDRLVQAVDGAGNPLFVLDAMGNPVLDDDGNPIPVLVTVPVAPVLRAGSASASRAFFAPFEAGGTHAGYLSAAERKLLIEWLDIGAQYYNDPFAVPVP